MRRVISLFRNYSAARPPQPPRCGHAVLPLRYVSLDRRGGTRDPLKTRLASRAVGSHSPCNHARWTKANPPDGLPIPPSPGSSEYTPRIRGLPSPSAGCDQRSAAGIAIPPRRGVTRQRPARTLTKATFGRRALRLRAFCNLANSPRTQCEPPPILIDIETPGNSESRSGNE